MHTNTCISSEKDAHGAWEETHLYRIDSKIGETQLNMKPDSSQYSMSVVLMLKWKVFYF